MKTPIGTPEHMLETLHMAYQYVLGNVHEKALGDGNSRLTWDQEKEFGIRLAIYWGLKSVSHQSTPPNTSQGKEG